MADVSCTRTGGVFTDTTETTVSGGPGEKLCEWYECDRCGESFSKKKRLKCHMCSNTGEKLYKCDTCGEEFVKRRLLKNHMCSQSETGQTKCSTGVVGPDWTAVLCS